MAKPALRREEKALLVESSISHVTKLENPIPREVKLTDLNEASSKVAREYADFETPWEQSLKLMVAAAGVQLGKQNDGSGEMIERITPQKAAVVS
jgi:hypothetical protein